MGNQCQMVNTDSLVGIKFMMVPSTTFMDTIFGIISVLALLTGGAFIIGFGCGYLKATRKLVIEKMTMTPVTYTAVRKVQHPRFEFSTTIEVCW